MHDCDRADDDPPHDAGYPGDGETSGHIGDERHPAVPIEESKLGEARQIPDVREVGMIVRAVEDPTDVRMPEATHDR